MRLRSAPWIRLQVALFLTGAALCAGPASAFAPEAAQGLAIGAVAAAVGPDAQTARVPEALDRVLSLQDEDPEGFAARQRCDALASPEISGGPSGDALMEFARALRGLEQAAGSDAAAWVDVVARLALIAAGLSDPFQTSPPSPDEADGARARFSDDVSPALAASAAANGCTPLAFDAAVASARALARESALLRREAERVALSGDAEALEALQRSRLLAASALLTGSVMGAPLRAPIAAPPLLPVAVQPNPARGAVSVTFQLPQPGAVSIAVYDAAGRRKAASRFEELAAGRQSQTLGAPLLDGLPAGVYFVRIEAGAAVMTGRFIRIPR